MPSSAAVSVGIRAVACTIPQPLAMIVNPWPILSSLDQVLLFLALHVDAALVMRVRRGDHGNPLDHSLTRERRGFVKGSDRAAAGATEAAR
jgi:hypothetical protein